MFKIFKRLSIKDWLGLLLILGFVIAQVYLDLKLPEYTEKLTEYMNGTTSFETKDVWINGGWMLLCALGSMAMAIGASLFSTRIAANFSRVYRKDLFNKIMGLSDAELKNYQVSTLVTRITNDIVQIQMFIGFGLHVLLKGPITGIWAICKISNSHIEWTTATIITVVAIVISVSLVITLALPKFKKIQKLTDNLNNVTRENVSGVRVIRAFNAEEYQENKFENANIEMTKNQTFTAKITGALMPIMTLAMSGLTLAIYWIAAYLMLRIPGTEKIDIASRSQVIAQMMSFSQYALQIVTSFILLIVVFVLLPRAIVSSNRINEVMDTFSSIKEGKYNENSKEKGSVEFKNVSFKYPDGKNYVVKDLNFKVKKGETLALIGATGCGKTTIIDLIPRFYDTSKGDVLVDGINVKEYTEENLQKKISLVPQKISLFKGDIKSNISYGSNDIDLNKINKCIEMSESDFILKLPKGIDNEVAQGGTNYSGGQKQRLSIARAFYKDSEIIIFDDSFSALDYKTDFKVRKNIKDNLKDKTIIIVAQRIGTIRNADKILVIDDGKIVGEGKHKDLLNNCKVYKDIALSQLSREEL